MSKEATASGYWGGKRGYAPNWYSFCMDEIQVRITGSPEAPTLWALRRCFPAFPIGHLLEIGCLNGVKLAQFKLAGVATCVSGVDVAADAIARGRAERGAEVNFDILDLNRDVLPRNAYDAVLANGVLHHISRIDHCLASIAASLRSGGALIATEFTGPRRYRYSRAEIDAINEGKRMLPEELRGAWFHPSQLDVKLKADPSESVTTRGLEPALRRHFEDVEARPFGGNVLMRALGPEFFARFDATNPAHVAAIDGLITFDTQVSKAMGSHHVHFLARKPRLSGHSARLWGMLLGSVGL